MEKIHRPALGADVELGTLYDAHTDNFLSTSAYASGFQEGDTVVEWQKKDTVVLSQRGTQVAKFKTLNLASPLAASCLAGWVEYKGAGLFLNPSPLHGEDTIHHTLHFTTTTIKQELDLAKATLAESCGNRDSNATHFVSQRVFGCCFTITATGSVSDPEERAEIVRNMEDASRILKHSSSGELSLATFLTIAGCVLDSRLTITCYSDLLPEGDRRPSTPTQAMQRLENMFDLSSTTAGYESAKPVSYILTPIETSKPVQSSIESVGQLEEAHLKGIIDKVNDYAQAFKLLEKHYQRLRKNRSWARPDDIIDCQCALEDIKTAEAEFHSRFVSLLSSVRRRAVDDHDVQDFLDEFSTGPSSPKQFLAVTKHSAGKMDFIESVSAKGARCVSSRDFPKHAHEARYAFYFSGAVVKQPSWKQNLDLVITLLEKQASSGLLFAVDCDNGGPPLAKARVTEFRSGKVYVEDMIETYEHEASLCFILFDAGASDAGVKDAPSQHKSVRIPCPRRECGRKPRDWVCRRCRMKVEFGVIDPFLYCDCGRSPINSASFNCQQGHGQSYARYPPQEIRALLQNLPTPPEINILILGETGVGKSTFINSFINYLSFDKLDEALKAGDLNYIIPCAFSTQSVGPNGKLVKRQVRIGQDNDEHDGTRGESATQESNVYSVYHGGGMVRLIDTPGIGDTRGKDQDEQNLMKILRVLRNYEKLHGILILLKPNNARLNIMFKYCIKELLTQLHRSAAQNIVFGFTNTRGSNYQPGDTFQPLETLLKDHEDVIPGLYKDTVYCFDSESFRYLAARHKGVDMGHIEDYRRSWDHSVVEARRMVTYFQDRSPHEVRSTVSLNETRYLIAELIQPMARISNAIAGTVQKSQQQITELENTRLEGTELAKQLTVTKTVIDSKPLDRPRTVCSNSECCSYTTDSSRQGARVTIFKRKCHDPCQLKDVPPDVIGAQQIPPCLAFNGHENCQVCGHHWKEHQHIMVEYSERTETSTDPRVQQALRSNGDVASAKKMQIGTLQKLVRELLDEQQMLQKSQARFSHYLQQHSMVHYNDATIEYYQHLLRDEKSKVAQGADRTRLEQLETDQATYQSFVDAMKRGKQHARHGPLDADGVYRLIKELYSMKHYGSNLRDCAKKTGQAYAGTYREKAYRVRRGNSGSTSWGWDVPSHARPGNDHVRDVQFNPKSSTNPFMSILPSRALDLFKPNKDHENVRQGQSVVARSSPTMVEKVSGSQSWRSRYSGKMSLVPSTSFDEGHYDEDGFGHYYGESHSSKPAQKSLFPSSPHGLYDQSFDEGYSFCGPSSSAGDGGSGFKSIRAMEAQQSPSSRGFGNNFFDEDDAGDQQPPAYSDVKDSTFDAGSSNPPGRAHSNSFASDARDHTGANEQEALQRSKSKWFSSVKNKLKGRK